MLARKERFFKWVAQTSSTATTVNLSDNTAEIEKWIQEEYKNLRPALNKLRKKVKKEIRTCLSDFTQSLEPWQRIEIRSRIKECNSAIDSLRKRNFHTLNDLVDLVGIRIVVFPASLAEKVEGVLIDYFKTLVPDHYFYAKNEIAFRKYNGLTDDTTKIKCEIQIMPEILYSLVEVEHDFFYKVPDKNLSNENEFHEIVKRLLAYDRALEQDMEHRSSKIISCIEEKSEATAYKDNIVPFIIKPS